jgi:predicted HNH restriction endonuclease
MNKAIITAVLLIVAPERYGVWNDRSEKSLRVLGVFPPAPSAAPFSDRYLEMNKVLLELASEIDVDLWTLDFLHYALPERTKSERTARRVEDAVRLENGYLEGEKATRLLTQYRRNSCLRWAAIDIHGTRCQVCGMSFAERYGEIGTDFIEVHHLKPVADNQGEVVVLPETDMAVVCANCHRMLHRGPKAPLTIEKLRTVLRG